MQGLFGSHLLGRGAEGLGEDVEPEVVAAFGPFVVLLGQDGADEADNRVPEDVLLFAYGPEQATEHERGVIDRRKVKRIPVGEDAADPEGAAASALDEMEPRCERLLIHFDVDTVDFTDLPLSENTGRNEGLPFEAAAKALGTLLGSRRLAAVTVTEFNPDHGEVDGSTARALAEGLADALSGSSAPGRGTGTTSKRDF